MPERFEKRLRTRPRRHSAPTSAMLRRRAEGGGESLTSGPWMEKPAAEGRVGMR